VSQAEGAGPSQAAASLLGGLERLTYDDANRVTCCSDKVDGSAAGRETVDPLEFLARVLTHERGRRG
jgi:hypothetical protein